MTSFQDSITQHRAAQSSTEQHRAAQSSTLSYHLHNNQLKCDLTNPTNPTDPNRRHHQRKHLQLETREVHVGSLLSSLCSLLFIPCSQLSALGSLLSILCSRLSTVSFLLSNLSSLLSALWPSNSPHSGPCIKQHNIT
jgi:uncharacterized membrane protein YkgB